MRSVNSLTEEPCLALSSLLEIGFNMEVVSLIYVTHPQTFLYGSVVCFMHHETAVFTALL